MPCAAAIAAAADSLSASRVAQSSSCRFNDRIVLTPVTISDNLSRIWIRKSNCSARSASLVAIRGSLSSSNDCVIDQSPTVSVARYVPGLASGPLGRLWNSVSTIFSPFGIGHRPLEAVHAGGGGDVQQPLAILLVFGNDARERFDLVAVAVADRQACLADGGLVEEVHDANASFEVLAGIDDPLAHVTGLELVDVERRVLAAGDVIVLAARRAAPRRRRCAAECGPRRVASAGTGSRTNRSSRIWCSGVRSSRIQNDRPCVATTRSVSLTTKS